MPQHTKNLKIIVYKCDKKILCKISDYFFNFSEQEQESILFFKFCTIDQ